MRVDVLERMVDKDLLERVRAIVDAEDEELRDEIDAGDERTE